MRHEFGRTLPSSTLYRHLRREGATRLKLGVSTQKIRCRWTREHSNALWLGDFEHGPAVMHEGQAVKTHLSAWIDCHSRYIVEARYYLRENLDILIDSLLRAWVCASSARAFSFLWSCLGTGPGGRSLTIDAKLAKRSDVWSQPRARKFLIDNTLATSK